MKTTSVFEWWSIGQGLYYLYIEDHELFKQMRVKHTKYATYTKGGFRVGWQFTLTRNQVSVWNTVQRRLDRQKLEIESVENE